MDKGDRREFQRGLLAGLVALSPAILGLVLIYVMEVIEWLR